jgi:adenine-specific DNA-methyltransferase
MATTDTKQQLKDLLRELFQLNNTDLDFGIYRILNIKAKEVESFIEKDIDAKIESVKDKIIDRQSGDIKAELEEAKAKLEKDFKVDFQKDGDLEAKVGQFGQLELFMEPFNRFKTAKDKLDNLRVSEDTEKSIYNELYRFFERYYEGGDFISKPRAGKNNYMIPYEGEEVKLYWANYDQYYIKTGDNFKNYLFNNQSADPKTLTQIEFRILDADTAINNNKEEKGRLFVPAEEPFEWIAEERKLLVKFYYRVPTADEKKTWGDKQSVKTDNKGINQKLAALVNDAGKKIGDTELLLFLSKTRNNSKGEAIPLFLYHLERYTTVNKFDYFIHKDLKGFLQRELDTFLKNDVFSIAFLDPAWKEQEVQEAIKNNVLKASAIRDIAMVVIDFMSELEEFQKRLFEKKKFVVESHYCMTLDRIPESVYEDVVHYILTDKDKKQIQDWIDLKFISGSELEAKKTKDKKEDEYADAKAFLKTNDKLVLDTKYLTDELKWRLLTAFENIEDQTDGVLINSENWQALNFIFKKYSNKIKVSYIDPPYNTELDRQQGKFVYKDSFEHSTWLAMMKDRIAMSGKMLEKNGIHFQSIGDDELHNSISLYQTIGYKVLGTFSWKRTRTGGHLSNTVNKITDYVIIADKARPGQMLYGGKADPDESQPMNKDGNSIKTLSFKPGEIEFINEEDDEFTIESGEYGTTASKVKVLESILVKKKKNVNEAKLEGNFTWTQDFLEAEIERGARIIVKEKKRMLPRFFRESEHSKPFPSMPNEDVQVGTNEDGSALLFSLFNSDKFDYPKPISLLESLIEAKTYFTNDGYVIDYFAGSGTTGHAVINLNRRTEGSRKYILVEMGNYFNDVTKPRILKAIYSNKWDKGVPEKNNSGISHLLQYIKLEQYEDTLNNIEIHTTAPQLSFLDNIRYQLIHGTKGSDSLINLEKFTKPFDYSMKIVQQNEPKEGTNIDLITTFNFLLGIEVQRYVLAANNGLDYKIVIGKKGLQQFIIIWRNFDENSIDMKTEKEFITKQDWYNTTAFVYCNGDNAFSAHPIEPEFIRLMNEPVI